MTRIWLGLWYRPPRPPARLSAAPRSSASCATPRPARSTPARRRYTRIRRHLARGGFEGDWRPGGLEPALTGAGWASPEAEAATPEAGRHLWRRDGPHPRPGGLDRWNDAVDPVLHPRNAHRADTGRSAGQWCGSLLRHGNLLSDNCKYPDPRAGRFDQRRTTAEPERHASNERPCRASGLVLDDQSRQPPHGRDDATAANDRISNGAATGG